LKIGSNKPETPDTGVVINLYPVSSAGQFGAVLWRVMKWCYCVNWKYTRWQRKWL